MKRGDIYPSWRYHATEPPVLCQDAEQDAQLGSEWSDADIRVFEAINGVPVLSDDEHPAGDIVDAPKKRGRKPKA